MMAFAREPKLYDRIRRILESARAGVARSVNTAQVVANWLIGREIVEEEQKGKRRAGYGERLMKELAARLAAEYGPGYGLVNLKLFKQFYIGYPGLADLEKNHAVRSLFPRRVPSAGPEKGYAARSQSRISHSRDNQSSDVASLIPAPASAKWQPGVLHPHFSWTHYRTLLRVDKREARAFYEIEALKNNWSARELERQINSLLYERLAKSRDKTGLLKLATKGQEIQQPVDVFKDPMVIEFLGLPESPRLVESRIEEALINNLQDFLLELGKGFAFVARQKRITLDGDHFYIDLVFYHTILKCHVLIDLKVGKLTHQDLGQLQLYVNYYDRELRSQGDNPTLGLILCTDKNDAVVRYTLGPDQQRKIFASRYKLHLPTEKELEAEIRRELEVLRGNEGMS